MERTKISVKMSRFDIYVEIFCLIAFVSYWIYLSLVYKSLPGQIPIHYNYAGKVDGYGNKSDLYELPRVATILYVVLTGVNLVILFFNDLLVFSVQQSESRLKKTIRTVAVCKLLIVIIFLAITFFIVQKV